MSEKYTVDQLILVIAQVATCPNCEPCRQLAEQTIQLMGYDQDKPQTKES